jgi:tRNA (Thr-GGU) A37 N-methylase
LQKVGLSTYLKPIGVVEKGLECCGEGKAARSRYEQVSIVKIFDEFANGLEGLEEYSYVIVVYWMHKVAEVRLRVRPWVSRGFLLLVCLLLGFLLDQTQLA